jgi:hypothetical protein
MSVYTFRDSGALVSWCWTLHLPRRWAFTLLIRLPRRGWTGKVRANLWNERDWLVVP